MLLQSKKTGNHPNIIVDSKQSKQSALFLRQLIAKLEKVNKSNGGAISNIVPMDDFLKSIFSSPEPKAQGELIGWESSGRPSVCPHFQT